MIVGIAGIIITVIIGILPFIINLNEKTIRYWHVETESIFSDKIKEIKQLKVSYKDKEINDKIIILKTVIENNGKKDIDKSIVHEPMKINFSKAIELLEVEKIQAPGNVVIEKEDNSIICKWDLLKKKEFIILKVLLKNKDDVKMSSDNLLNKYCNLSYRITDLSKSKKINYTKSISEKIDFKFLILPIIYFIISIVGIFSIKFSTPYSIKYQDVYFNGSAYTIQVKDNNNIILKSGKEKISLTLDEYNNKEIRTKLKPVISVGVRILLILYYSILSLSLILLIIFIFILKRDKKIHMFFEKEKTT